MVNVLLANERGEPTGQTCEIVKAHTGEGQRHLAFSVYVFRNLRREILIQRRSDKKMLWPTILANTCCSHPRDQETAKQAGQRRLQEELGFTCELQEGPSFEYRAEDPNGNGVEHEYVTTLLGDVDDVIVIPNPDEVSEYKWVDVDQLIEDMNAHPDAYAPWFHIGLQKIIENK